MKKTISYQNLDGETTTEDFYFQITKAEVAEKALIEGEGYGDMLSNLSVQKDGAKIIAIFKDILMSAVGRRDGQLFIKDKDAQNHFMYSGAYDAFFMEMLESPDSGAGIIKAMLPKDIHAAIDDELKKRDVTTVELPATAPQLESVKDVVDGEVADAAVPPTNGSGDTPKWLKEKRSPTKSEMQAMSKDEMMLVFKAREEGAIA